MIRGEFGVIDFGLKDVKMKTKIMFAAAAVAFSASAAFASDLPASKGPAEPVVVSPWDFAIGATLTSDYIFRGVTQSNHKPSVWGRAEIRYNIDSTWQLYAGAAGASIKLSPWVPSPSMELDGMAGVRATFGNLGVDVGAIVYGYPNTPGVFYADGRTITWWEGYAKPTYTFNDMFTIGANLNVTPSFLNMGANGTYLSATAKITLPQNIALSGEFGRQWLGTTDAVLGAVNLPDYNYWNVGASYAYKFATLDLRYHGSDLNKNECASIAGPTVPGGLTSRYCGHRFVGTISFDLTSKDLK